MKKMIDFAANLNPYGPPEWSNEILSDSKPFHAYPELWHHELDRNISNILGLLDDKQAISLPGTSSFIFSFPGILEKYEQRSLNWGILAPTFWEFKESLAVQNLSYQSLDIRQSINKPNSNLVSAVLEFVQKKNIDVLILNIPNNPTGHAISAEAIKDIAQTVPDTKIVLDLTYAFFKNEFDDYIRLFSDASVNKQITAIASLSKFYALPGLRIGIGIFGDTQLATHSKIQLGPVRVNAAAEKILPDLMHDKEYISSCRLNIQKNVEHLRGLIEQHITWLHPMSTDACFGLYKISEILKGKVDEEALCQFLETKGIKIASGKIYNLEGYVRIRAGLQDDNLCLVNALSEFSSSLKLDRTPQVDNTYKTPQPF